MSKKMGKLKGLPAVQSAISLNITVWAAVRMAHIENPGRSMIDISKSVLSIFCIQDLSPRALLATYYRLEASFLNEVTHEQG